MSADEKQTPPTTANPSPEPDTVVDEKAAQPETEPKSREFFLTLLAIGVTTVLSALDLTGIGTTLPTISKALDDTKGEFVWIGSAYALASTAFIPLMGNLADAFGRRPVVLTSIAFFALGSALSGAAQSMTWIIAARAVQGVGGGGILALSEILIADLVPLAERGAYQGFLALVWSIGSCIGPPIGGALANVNDKAWRWLFWLNLPLCGISFVLVALFLHVRTPPGTLKSKLAQVDWIGNLLVVFGSGLVIIGLTWGGSAYAWNSAHVLATLIIGFVLLIVFGLYEAFLVKAPVRPTTPGDILGNRTSLGGLISTAVHGLVSIALIYYLPVYYQACFDASPIRSAVDFLPSGLLTAPFAFLAGVATAVLKKYRPVQYFAWVFCVFGYGIFSLQRVNSPQHFWLGVQIPLCVGLGMLFSCPVFPILAPLPPQRAASALALWTFTRSFFQAWGIAIGGTVLENELSKKLPQEFIAQVGSSVEIAYSAIPVIRTLTDQALKLQVQTAFADSLRVVWLVMCGISGLGFLSCFLLREIPMGTQVDETYTLKETKEQKKLRDAEAQEGAAPVA
ncbi:Iron permease [Mycena chlorophos]|uniref:Iron permease n=2 Tax=Mycena chlorophos TaxID=658473 RepID=A0ABQ0LT88_MYCCL|nr:Iron permease [Mycena chlorophos]GAT54293.1 iron permease [Mycena chlorophos]